MKVAIIGTAGRREDGTKLNRHLYQMVLDDVRNRLKLVREPIHLVSGGAAYMDHLAVLAYLRDFPNVESLELFFPCEWEENKFQENKVGGIANWYHGKFSLKMGGKKDSSLVQIQKAITKGATYHAGKGFHQRNIDVGCVDYILAYTFGDSLYEPKDGGTNHTWKNSKAGIKIHIPISLIGEQDGKS